MRRRPPVLPLAVVLAVAVACGGGEEAACGPVSREALDPNSGLHLLPDEGPPDYATDPPTSGAHYALPPPVGAQEEPLERPMQVTVLEGGQVLVQHRGLDGGAVDELEALAGDEVVVAPNDDQVDPVVLTAWTTRQTCSGVDAEAIEDFVEEQRGRGPGADF